MPAYCGSWAIIAEDEDGVRHALPLRCRSWGCTICGPRNKRRLMHRLEGTTAYSMLTLTCSVSRWHNPTDAFHGMSSALDTLIKRLRRHTRGRSLEYFLVWERTAKGWPHLHLLIQGPYIDQVLLSRHWRELTGAPIVDIRRVQGINDVTAYISKYLSKDPAVPPGCRRYRCSRKFLLGTHRLRPDGKPRARYWALTRTTAVEQAMNWSLEGYTCHLHPDGAITAFPRGHPGAPEWPSPALMVGQTLTPVRLSYPRPQEASSPSTGSSPSQS